MCSNVAHIALNTPCKILITQGLRRVILNNISNKVNYWYEIHLDNELFYFEIACFSSSS